MTKDHAVITHGWPDNIRVWYVGSKDWCKEFINQEVDKIWAEYEGKAQQAVVQYLIDLNDAEPCNYAPAEWVVYHQNSTEYFDDDDELNEAIERCIDGTAFADYINVHVPSFQIKEVG